MKQYMVRIFRDTDDDWADVVVDAHDKQHACTVALNIVKRDPSKWFDVEPPPSYMVDYTTPVEDVTGGEYASCNEDDTVVLTDGRYNSANGEDHDD